jgi:hypothetical protein
VDISIKCWNLVDLAVPPNGPINVTIRVYWPKEELLNGVYKIPPLRKV